MAKAGRIWLRSLKILWAIWDFCCHGGPVTSPQQHHGIQLAWKNQSFRKKEQKGRLILDVTRAILVKLVINSILERVVAT
jgi:hypothetical protein